MRTNIGETLKTKRHESCLSQSEFAKLLGVSTFAYFHWEKENKLPSWEFLPKICSITKKEIHLNPDGSIVFQDTIKKMEKMEYSEFMESLNETIWLRGLTVPKMTKKDAIGMWRSGRCNPSIPILLEVLEQLNAKIIFSDSGFKFLLL